VPAEADSKLVRSVCTAVALVAAVFAVATALMSRSAPATASTNSSNARVPKGWAPGGNDEKPRTQYKADVKDMAHGGCGVNAALLFRVRGSGSRYGGYPINLPNGDRLGEWLIGAGQELVKRGWRVRGLQAIYPAPSLPSITKPLNFKSFRDAATKAAPTVRNELIAAYKRCPSRSIFIAGHSLGDIVLRGALRQLPKRVLAKIVRVDLFADPTADSAVDGQLQHPAALDGRRTNSGIDTAAARLGWKAGKFILTGPVVRNLVNFRQKPYPIPKRVFQYCVPYDVVCDVNPVNIAKMITDSEKMGRIHISYEFAVVGRLAARSLRSYASAPKDGPISIVSPDAIGRIHLGATAAQVISAFGSPNYDGSRPQDFYDSPFLREIWYGGNPRTRDGKRLFGFGVQDGDKPSLDNALVIFRTYDRRDSFRGVHPGDTIARLKRILPNASHRRLACGEGWSTFYVLSGGSTAITARDSKGAVLYLDVEYGFFLNRC